MLLELSEEGGVGGRFGDIEIEIGEGGDNGYAAYKFI